VLTALGLGAVGYATQAGLFFAALERMDASLLSLVLYTYPAWVALSAAALGRETLTPAGSACSRRSSPASSSCSPAAASATWTRSARAWAWPPR
jgi:hypothetical protein